MHRVAIARTEGFDMTFQDTDALPRATPRLTPLFPNGEADVNEFNRVGGTAFLLRELLNSGLIHDDVDTVMGHGLSQYTQALSYAPADQGPRACDMRELHQLTPTLSVLLERGLKVALVTDRRMSRAAGRVPAAIQVTPEASAGGALARELDADMVTGGGETGTLHLHLDEATLAAPATRQHPLQNRDGAASCSQHSATMSLMPIAALLFWEISLWT